MSSLGTPPGAVAESNPKGVMNTLVGEFVGQVLLSPPLSP